LLVVACLALPWAIHCSVSAAGTVVGDGLVLSCSQPESLELRCDYRLTRPGHPLAAVASVSEVALPAPSFAARTGDTGTIATLILVDTSDPGRAPAIGAIRKHVSTLVESASSQKRFGLAAFDSDLELLAPIGSTPEALKSAAASLAAKGSTTELYRNVVEATKLLATATDEHKMLIVISDGLAEDSAYFHRDAVDAALDARITIHAIGYPRSVALSVGLQSLRRLADETGGRFVATSAAFALPDRFFDTPLVAAPNIGALGLNLASAAARFAGGSHHARIGLETSAGLVEARVPITLPIRSTVEPVVKVVEVEVPKVIEVEKIVRVPAAPLPARRPAPVKTSEPTGVPLWYWVVAIGLLALALLVLLLVLLFQRRSEPKPAARPSIPPPAPLPGLAYLTLSEGEDEPSPINSATFRIGRLSDNDLVLRDPSVSRHHAEIRRRRDGSFQVIDLDSMNGILVNSKKVLDGDLRHGDVLEVGDVQMSFTVGEHERFAGEDTVMMKTALPDIPFPEAAGGQR
jgi:hypothetical protein